MTRALWFLFALSVLNVFAGCGDDATEDQGEKNTSSKANEVTPFARELAPPNPDSPNRSRLHFVDRARDAGIDFRPRSGTADKLWIPENIGHGCALFDYDNDGDLDLYLANGGDLRRPNDPRYPNTLWRNDGDWKFVDVTKDSGTGITEWTAGVYSVDYDADGYRDLYLTQLGKNRLLRNLQGSGRFEDVTDTAGGGDEGYGAGAAFFDADGDGDLDLYCGNYVEFKIDAPPNDGVPCEWKTLAVCCGPRGLIEPVDVFYENVEGRFVEATEKFGFAVFDDSGRRMGSYTLGVIAGDFDDDGDQDVYVAVDSRPNLFFLNEKGRFKEVASEWLLALNHNSVEQAGMGVASADLTADMRNDLFVTNFSHDTNTLYVADGEPGNFFFEDLTSHAGLGGEASYQFLSWGTGIHDFDLDGCLDIFVASGHVYPQADTLPSLGSSYRQQNQLFMGSPKKMRFKNMADTAGPAFQIRRVSRGTAFGDIDRDGRVDFVVTNVDDWPTLVQNQSATQGAFLGLELLSATPANRSAVGAKVIAHFADGSKMRRDRFAGGSYFSSHDEALHFGLGQKTLQSLEVTWPNGKTTTHKAPAPGRYYRIEQQGETVTPISGD